jgi:hypothetical protein
MEMSQTTDQVQEALREHIDGLLYFTDKETPALSELLS